MASSDEPDDVLSRLPRNRPARRSTRRASAPNEATGAEPMPDPARRASAQNEATEPEPVPDPARRPVEPPSGAEILQSAVHAAGDLAAVGIAVGREALKAVVSKLPRP